VRAYQDEQRQPAAPEVADCKDTLIHAAAIVLVVVVVLVLRLVPPQRIDPRPRQPLIDHRPRKPEQSARRPRPTARDLGDEPAMVIGQRYPVSALERLHRRQRDRRIEQRHPRPDNAGELTNTLVQRLEIQDASG
jgi:hypothetical protein